MHDLKARNGSIWEISANGSLNAFENGLPWCDNFVRSGTGKPHHQQKQRKN
jgi:hypothetical protein